MDTHEVNPHSLIGFEQVLITKAALEKVEKWLEPRDEGEWRTAATRQTGDCRKEDAGRG